MQIADQVEENKSLNFLHYKPAGFSGYCEDMRRDVIETTDEFSRDIAEV